MSRSRRKTPKRGLTAKTEKENKRHANRKYRRTVKVKIKKGEEELPAVRELSNVWAFAKDGKWFLEDPTEKDLRK